MISFRTLLGLSACVFFAMPGCSTSGGGASGAGGCTFADECDALEFCHLEACQPVLGREFSIVLGTGTAVTDAGWDVGGGAPDPFVSVTMDGGRPCVSSTRSDTFTPTWSEVCDVVLSEGGELVIEMDDEDVASADPMLIFTARGSDDLVALAVIGYVEVSNDSASLSFEVVPTF